MIVEYDHLKLKIEKGVYQPSDDTFLLIDNLNVKAGDFVLEIGTGTGLVSLKVAQLAEKIIATDISPIAVKLARSNVELNGLTEKIEIRQGHLFEPIQRGEKFDIILFNPPYLPEAHKKDHDKSNWIEKAWDGGKTGRDIIDPFIKSCKNFLSSKARVQIIQSSLSNISKTIELFETQGFQIEIGAEKAFFFEKLFVLNAWL